MTYAVTHPEQAPQLRQLVLMLHEESEEREASSDQTQLMNLHGSA